ncbi:hypothetical protein K490DRAFT_58241 [Saccharata proteae CBS 121410]|uniref:Uncharacterized protein n=1 Tax=Saccharata proteae CBS 121410 TaxID=1314787 RepID=A0A9P4LTV9_9PEZI|nr:hypothetical protein K490DRAFT_58241 [Saccharata proteae CBS 121410]
MTLQHGGWRGGIPVQLTDGILTSRTRRWSQRLRHVKGTVQRDRRGGHTRAPRRGYRRLSAIAGWLINERLSYTTQLCGTRDNVDCRIPATRRGRRRRSDRAFAQLGDLANTPARPQNGHARDQMVQRGSYREATEEEQKTKKKKKNKNKNKNR